MTDERDEDLARSSRDGDHRAFGELVDRYQRPIFTLTLRMTGSRDTAEELTQIVFVKAWRGLGGFDTGRRFFSWIYRIAIHECLNHRRASGRYEPLEPDLESSGSAPDDDAVRNETETQVQAALKSLNAADREIVVMRHFLELSYEEIAEALGVAAKTVKSRLFTARQRLKAELERAGVRGS